MTKFEIAKSNIENGTSKIFENWNEYAGISAADFLTALEWLYQDPALELNERGFRKSRLTRQVACSKKRGLIKLRRAHDTNGDFIGFYELDTNRRWMGHISISAEDKI